MRPVATASRSPNPPGPGNAKGEEGSVRVAGVAGPPADLDLLAFAELRVMKSCAGGSTGSPEKRLTARSKLPHQALTGDDRPRYGARSAASTSAARVAAAKYSSPATGCRWCARGPRPAASSTASLVAWDRTGQDRRGLAAASTSPVSRRRPDGSAPSGMRCARPSLCSATA